MGFSKQVVMVRSLWPAPKTYQAEIRATFAIPATATKLGVSVLVGRAADGTSISTDFFVNFAPNPGDAGSWEVTSGFDTSTWSMPRAGWG